jgi:hypothetical protein
MSETQAEPGLLATLPSTGNGQGPYIAPVPPPSQTQDVDPAETQEWLDSLEYVLNTKGPERVKQLLALLDAKARQAGVAMPHDPAQPAAAISRQPRAGAADQEHHPLERDGDGAPGQQALRRPGRAHFDLRLVRDAV